METEQLTKEIEELKKQKKSLVEKREKIGNDFEQSEECKILNGEILKLDKEGDEFSREVYRINGEINLKFLNTDSSPSWSTIFGKNIHSEVINAIKQTFDFKRLTGSTIEEIVQKMIYHQRQIDEKRKGLEEKRDNLNLKKTNKQSEKYDLKNELTKTITNEIQELSESIDKKEEELIRIKLEEGEDVKKEELQNPYLKKQALNRYREDCEHNFIKVFEKLKWQER